MSASSKSTNGPMALPQHLTRRQAITRVCRLVKRHGQTASQALHLITLFGLHPEELLEAGLCFEQVVGLEALCWATTKDWVSGS